MRNSSLMAEVFYSITLAFAIQDTTPLIFSNLFDQLGDEKGKHEQGNGEKNLE